MTKGFAFIGLFGFPILIICIIGIAFLVFEIAMIVSAIKNKQIADNTRVLWVIGMLLIHPFVAIAYYFTDHKKRL